MLALLSTPIFSLERTPAPWSFKNLAQESYIEKRLYTRRVKGSSVIGLII